MSFLNENEKQPSSSTSLTLKQFRQADHFIKVDGILSNGENGKLLQCIHCDHAPFQPNLSSTRFSDHVSKEHNFEFIKNNQKFSSAATQVQLSKEKVHAIDCALAFFLTCCFIPFSIIKSQYFINFFNELNPNYKIPDREYLNQLINEIYTRYKKFTIN